jgi:hypothetical protein
MAQTFEIKDGKELNNLRDSKTEYLYQDSVCKARVYQLSDGRVMAYPAVGARGIITQNRHAMQELLKNGFPIESDDPNPFEADRKRLQFLDDHIGQYLNELSAKLNIPVHLNDDSPEYCQQITKAVKAYGLEKAYDEIFVQLGVFVGEKIRMKYGGKWHLITQYSYNPYYEPELLFDNKKTFSPWHHLVRLLIEKKQFNFQSYFKKAEMEVDRITH